MAAYDKGHYTEGRKYETWDVITDWGLGYLTGSALKYISRAGRKVGNSEAQDLTKAIDFLQKRLDNLGVGRNEITKLRGTAKTMEESYETKLYREEYDPT
jgi:hypothetical protein